MLLLSALTGKWDMNKVESLQLGTPTDSIQIRDRSLPMHQVIPVRQEVFHDIYKQAAKSLTEI